MAESSQVISQLTIKGFRGIRDFSFNPNNINIFVGPNNSGKTSILECAALLSTSLSNFIDSHDSNLLNYLFMTRQYAPRQIINKSQDISKIFGIINGKKCHLKLGYINEGEERSEELNTHIQKKLLSIVNEVNKRESRKYLHYYRRNKRIGDFIDIKAKKYADYEFLDEIISDMKNRQMEYEEMVKYLINILGEQSKKEQVESEKEIIDAFNASPRLTIEGKIDDDYHYYNSIIDFNNEVVKTWNSFAHLEGVIEQLTRTFNRKKLYNNNFEIIISDNKPKIQVVSNFNRLRTKSYFDELHDKVVSRGMMKYAIKLVTEKVPYISDIRKTDEDIYILLKDGDISLSLSQMGDGFLTLVKTIFLSTLAKDGVVLLDEPERSQHPGFLDITAESIIYNSNKSQFFIATHSLDFIKSMLNQSHRKDLLDKISIYRLFRRKDINNVEVEEMEGVDALNEVNKLGMDLRGI